MKILDAYKFKNSDSKYLDLMSSCGKEGKGNFYGYRNTNFRYNKSYRNGFEKFKEVAGLKRESWPIHPEYNQKIHKQYPLRMLSANLFMGKRIKDKENQVYELTHKGFVYNTYILTKMSKFARKFFDYLFISDMHFQYSNNYIITHTEEILNKFKLFFNIDDIIKHLKDFFIAAKTNKSIANLMKYKFFYMHSFVNDNDLLRLLSETSDEDFEELVEYVIQNKKNNSRKCFISKKYYTGGNYNLGMIFDDALTFYLSYEILKISPSSYEDFIETIIKKYSEFIVYPNIEDELINLIEDFEEALYVIFENLFNIDFGDIIDPIIDENLEAIDTNDIEREKIDTSTKKGKKDADRIYQMLKPIARETAKFKCELEKLNGCSYFTSKSTMKNYVEVHHLVPREYALEFDKSLESLANYISVCPACHKRIHLATDIERESLIRFLYQERIKRLNMTGINLTVEELLGYNKLDKFIKYIYNVED